MNEAGGALLLAWFRVISPIMPKTKAAVTSIKKICSTP